MIDEREHRRGLVLGLTLAEVLLLLLFVLLLALGSRFASLEKANAKLQTEASQNKERFITGSIEVPSPKDESSPLQGASPGKGGSELTPATTILDIGVDAATINPDDPPQVLAIIREFLKFGVNKDNLTALSEATGIKLEIDARASSTAVLARTVEILKQAIVAKRESKYASGGQTAGKPDGEKGKHNWPPIITLSEADGRFFQSGSAELSSELRGTITGKVIAKLLETVKTYDVNVIEVIGHTDEQPIAARASDLDKTLAPYVRRLPEVNSVVPADNAGLGLARAASVARLLGDDRRLSGIRILPLSGGQLINLDDTLTGGLAPGSQEQRRRRIEIRVRRTDKPLEQQVIAPLAPGFETPPTWKTSVQSKEKKEPMKEQRPPLQEHKKSGFDNTSGP